MSTGGQRPVSAYRQLGGLYFLPRTLDKVRLHARGDLHADHHAYLGQGFDGRLCHFLGLTYEELRERTLAGGSDEEILDWIRGRGRPITAADVLIWNGFAAKRGWRDDATPRLEADKAASGLAHRGDLLTFFDYYEVDEGRAPR